MMIITVIGADVAARSPYAIYDSAKQIKFGNFLERIEIIVGAVWFLTSTFKLILVFFTLNLSMAQWFKLKDYRSLLLPNALLILGTSLIVSQNAAHLLRFVQQTWTMYNFIQGVLIPLLLFIIVFIQKKINTNKGK